MDIIPIKPVRFVGSSLEDLKSFPKERAGRRASNWMPSNGGAIHLIGNR